METKFKIIYLINKIKKLFVKIANLKLFVTKINKVNNINQIIIFKILMKKYNKLMI